MVTAAADKEPSLGIRLLSDLRDIFEGDDQMTTTVILDRLHSIPEAPWSDMKGRPLNDRGLAFRLRAYGIKSRTLNLGGESRAKGYAREDFYDAWKRYLPPPPPSPDTSVTSVTSAPNSDLQGFQGQNVTDVTGNERSVTDDVGEQHAEESTGGADVTDVTHVAGNGGAAPVEVCAQCGAAGPGPLPYVSAAEGTIRLHKECCRFWLREHPQPRGRAIAVVQISEVVPGTETLQ